MKAFRIMGRTLRATYEELFVNVFASLVWWAGTLLVIPAAPVSLGLHTVANRAANYRRTGMEFFWEAARARFGRAWLAFALLLAILLGILGNIYFYLVFAGGQGWRQVAAIVWIWVLFFYLMVAQYVLPLLCQQEEPSLLNAFRNAGLLALRSPLYSALMLVFQLLLLLLSFALILPVVVLTPAMLALAANFALTGLLQELDLAPQPPDLSRSRE